jgi:hypothetical protein
METRHVKAAFCRPFMTTPSVGAIVAITYKSALDDSLGSRSPGMPDRCLD